MIYCCKLEIIRKKVDEVVEQKKEDVSNKRVSFEAKTIEVPRYSGTLKSFDSVKTVDFSS